MNITRALIPLGAFASVSISGAKRCLKAQLLLLNRVPGHS
jgi:hypothetical protein